MMMDQPHPPVVEVVNEAGASRYVLICEHASPYIPPDYGDLGLPKAELSRHIAWDIGALDVARQLSHLLDAPLAYSNYSRLLIDLNRPVTSATSIPEVSETTRIPGNADVDPTERRHRIGTYFEPFHDRVASLLNARCQSPSPPIIVAIHSFTPVFAGSSRPWHAGVLFRKSAALGRSIVATLNDGEYLAAENEPYQIEDDGDYTVPIHGEARELDAVLIELRQDLIDCRPGSSQWANRLAHALTAS
jgi:predicted N-formylglutamate amidohydrolase